MSDKKRAIIMLGGVIAIGILVDVLAKFVQVALNLVWTKDYWMLNIIPIIYILILLVLIVLLTSKVCSFAYKIYSHHRK